MAQGKYTELFRFEVQGMEKDAFHVLSFRGREALSDLFSFYIELVSKNFSVDLRALLAGNAKLTIRREGAPDAVFAGRPAAARQLGHFNGYAYYSVTLRPAFWKFTQLVQSAIFIDKSAPDAVEEIISSERLFQLNYDMRLTREGYPAQEFAMQHEESDYDYITWRMEREGAYFYFAPDGDTVIFSDSPQSHDASAGTIYYSPATGLEGERRGEVATSFSLCQTPLPARVVVRSYNWKNPNVPVVGEAEVDPEGFGDVYLAHEPAETQAEATRIAEIRAEELKCRSRIFAGMSSSPIMRPGAVFTLDRHYNEAFNRDYMVTEATHEGAQEAFISLGLGIPLRGASDHLFYRNEFKCIESDVPYRPARKAPRAKITGVMRAFVDGAGSGARAETDEYGRYKLIFPFDISGRSKGSASCWIRMAQLQAGADSGFVLPVQPGTEALVSFEEGDPDRPYISGVLANGETGSIYGSGNQNISGLRTAGGNQITINDTDKKQGISMLMPTGNGMVMTAGSSDIVVTSTDTGLTATSTCSTDLAGLLKTDLAGFRSLTSTTTDPKSLAMWSSLCTSIGNTISDTLTTLSKAYSTSNAGASNKMAWSAGGIKDGALALSLILQTINVAALAGKTSYGVTLTAKDQQNSSTLVQSKAGVAELVSLIMSLVFRALTFSVDMGEAFSPKTLHAGKDDKGNDIYYDKNFNKVSKSAAIRSYTTSSAAAILPEITSTIVLLTSMYKQEKKLGGILLNAAKENVNLTAGTHISAHANKSILLHAGTIPDVQGNLMASNILSDMDSANSTLKTQDITGPSHWGVDRDESVASFVMDCDYGYLSQSQGINDAPNPSGKKNIASISDLLYERAENKMSVVTNNRVEHSGNLHIMRAGDNGATLELEKNQLLGYVPSTGKVILGTITTPGDYPMDAGKIADEDKLSGIIADKDGISINYNGESGVELNDTLAMIGVQEGATLGLTDKEANLSAKTVTIATTENANNAIEISSSGVKICRLKVTNSKMSADGALEFDGGVIKIG